MNQDLMPKPPYSIQYIPPNTLNYIPPYSISIPSNIQQPINTNQSISTQYIPPYSIQPILNTDYLNESIFTAQRIIPKNTIQLKQNNLINDPSNYLFILVKPIDFYINSTIVISAVGDLDLSTVIYNIDNPTICRINSDNSITGLALGTCNIIGIINNYVVTLPLTLTIVKKKENPITISINNKVDVNIILNKLYPITTSTNKVGKYTVENISPNSALFCKINNNNLICSKTGKYIVKFILPETDISQLTTSNAIIVNVELENNINEKNYQKNAVVNVELKKNDSIKKTDGKTYQKNGRNNNITPVRETKKVENTNKKVINNPVKKNIHS